MADTVEEFALPPATFEFLVESVLMQTQIQLGLLHFGNGEGEEQEEPNLPLARHSIDMLAMLQEKTRGNLSSEEQRLLENGLTELRFRYVQVQEEQNRKAAPPVDEGSRIIYDKDAPRVVIANDAPRIVLPDGGKGTKSE